MAEHGDGTMTREQRIAELRKQGWSESDIRSWCRGWDQIDNGGKYGRTKKTRRRR